jgi:hypothetical protein
MRMRNSQEVLAQKIAKVEAHACRLDVILYEPNERCFVSTGDATRISRKIASVRGKLEQVSQMYKDWDAGDDDERRTG